jgi:predicted sulfurtransferase
MKKMIAIVAVLTSLTATAGWVSTINGTISGNSKHTCTLTNNTGRDLDVKRVSFKLERRAGKERDVTRTQVVNNVIYSGETSSVTLSGATGAYIGHSCQFVVRN